ncbi:MAG: hypothetical protein ACRC5U_01590, partial [Plesiomonas sp.]
LGHQVVAILIDLSEIENKVLEGAAVLSKADGSQLNGREINRFFNLLKSPIMVNGSLIKVKGKTLSGKISESPPIN